MTVTREELEHLAKLAALQLNEAELDSLGKDIDSIVGYVWQLQEIDTEGVEPLLHPIEWAVSKPAEGVESYEDPDSLLNNVKHQINHRQIVVTSKKTEENS